MVKKIMYLCCMLALVGCNDVDISHYPESIQQCYNGIIYDNDVCTTNKRTIIKYCQCTDGKQPELDAYAAKLDSGVRAAGSMFHGSMRSFARIGLQNSASAKYDAFAEKIYDECAKKTGYTRVKNCKKDKK